MDKILMETQTNPLTVEEVMCGFSLASDRDPAWREDGMVILQKLFFHRLEKEKFLGDEVIQALASNPYPEVLARIPVFLFQRLSEKWERYGNGAVRREEIRHCFDIIQALPSLDQDVLDAKRLFCGEISKWRPDVVAGGPGDVSALIERAKEDQAFIRGLCVLAAWRGPLFETKHVKEIFCEAVLHAEEEAHATDSYITWRDLLGRMAQADFLWAETPDNREYLETIVTQARSGCGQEASVAMFFMDSLTKTANNVIDCRWILTLQKEPEETQGFSAKLRRAGTVLRHLFTGAALG